MLENHEGYLSYTIIYSYSHIVAFDILQTVLSRVEALAKPQASLLQAPQTRHKPHANCQGRPGRKEDNEHFISDT